jgi:hypothetical protein
MKRTAVAAMLSCAGLLVAGCAPADVSGMYTVAITNGDNGCNLSNFNMGQSSSVAFTISQTGAAVSGTTDGLVAAGLDLWLGGHVFTGTVNGTHVDMTLHGTRAMSMNGCAYTMDARVEGNLTGDALQGTITYSASAPDSAACSTISHCSTVQSFSGSRPPRS